MIQENGNRLFGLCLDHRDQLLCVRRDLALCSIQFEEARSLEEAEEAADRHSYCLSLVRCETSIPDRICAFCSRLRSRNPLAVLMAFMDRPDVSMEGRLFDCGMSDVVVIEQTSSSVLAKRIRAHLHANRILTSCPQRVRLGDVLVDFDRREVRREHAVYELPGILADLLKYFVQNADHVVSREELEKSPIWLDSICTPAEHGGKTFDVNVSRLRKIIEGNPGGRRIILSVRGVGWKLAPGVARDVLQCSEES